ncbi:nb-arc and tpr domain containing protein [Paramyrothecium foliicola]|nr:nb-arc and tpr domain containing protein [Paramyrothecium foliicola]
MADHERDMIIATCRQFEDLSLTIPVLSVYEGRKTKFKDNIFSLKKNPSQVLISESMVRINTRRESLIKVDKCHIDLCDIEPADALYGELVQFFSMFIRYGPLNMELHHGMLPTANVELTLRPKTSTSSISSTDSDTTFEQLDTPSRSTGNHRATSDFIPTPEVVITQQNSTQPEPFDQVKLPFSFTSSIIRNSKFYGRTEALDEIDKEFGTFPASYSGITEFKQRNASAGSPNIFVLCGMAGIGKSEVACEYLYSRRDQFDAVIWMWADTERKLGPQFVTLAKELNPLAAGDSTDEVSAREIVKQWLASPRGRRMNGSELSVMEARWLMIFDNADNPDVLYDWLPEQGRGCIIVTSKYPYVKEGAYRLDRGLQLDPFPPEDGAEMLRRLSNFEQGLNVVEASIRISKALGGLPLAIFQMSGIIRENHLSFKDFEDWYAEDAKMLYNLRARGMQTNYQYTVSTAWAIEQLGEAERSLLKVLSVLDPDRIPEDLLTEAAESIQLSGYPARKPQYFAARSKLIHASLITRNMATNELHIHRLVQDVVRSKLKNEDLHCVYSDAAILIASVWPWVSGTDPTRNQSWRIPIAENVTPHICKLEELCGQEIQEDKYNPTGTMGCLFSSYAWYVAERGLPLQSATFANVAVKVLTKAHEKAGGEDRDLEHWLGEAHHSASFAACMTGSSDGISDAKLWLRILQDRIHKTKRPSDILAQATAFNQLAICLVNANQLDEAMYNFRRSLTTFHSVKDAPQFSGTFPAISLTNLLVLQGKPEEGEQIIRPFLEEHENVLGVDDTTSTEYAPYPVPRLDFEAVGLICGRSGHIWRAMGRVRSAQQRHNEAYDYFVRAVRNIRSNLGDAHYFTGDCFYSLATCCIAIDKPSEALELREKLEQAIGAFKAAPHREAQAARALWKKGWLLLKQNGERQSKLDFEEAMSLRKMLVPNDTRPVEVLEDEDWTSLVFYWSR